MRKWASVALLAALLPAGPTWADDGLMRLHGIRHGHVLWLHAEPNAKAKKVGFIPAWGRNIRNLGCDQSTAGGWCQVQYRGTIGWAPGRFIRPGAPRLALERIG